MANSSLLKKNNMLDILTAIKNSGPVTKPEVARLTNLTNATVNSFINKLMEDRIVLEEGIADSNGGRRASLYKFNPRIAYVAGLLIGVKSTAVGIFDLDLNMLDKIEKKYDLNEVTVEEGVQFFTGLIESVIKKAKLKKEQVIGIGVSVPGPVDYAKGMVCSLTNVPKWKNVLLKDILERETGLPAIVDKDNNCNVLCLKWMDVSRNMKNVVYLSTFEGIGTGILVEGNVYRGNHCVAGEIGHISVNINGEKCNCGNRGCIELMASNLSIVERVRREIAGGGQTLASQLANAGADGIDMDVIVQAAKMKDPLTQGILSDAADYIGICISNAIKIYDPDEIIVHCTWLREFPGIFYRIMNNVYEGTGFIRRDDVSIILNDVKDLHITGAATLVIEYQFRSHENCTLLK